jgi:hypothetical protein
MWTTAATNDGAVKGVYAVEIGAIHYGNSARGGGFSGDGINIETRWAYTDLQIPFIERKSRVRLGLQNVDMVNYYLWHETAAGVKWYGDTDMFDYTLGWFRGFERIRTADSGGNSVDSFVGRTEFKQIEGLKLGVFALYTHSNGAGASGAITDESYQVKRFASSDLDLNIWNLGVDGSYKTDVNSGNLFFKWDAIYQTGKIDDTTFASTNQTVTAAQNMDLSAYFVHADAGYAWDDFKVTGTFWYASGDDDGDDDDLKGFLSYDVDTFTGSTVLMESYDDDNYFTERSYLLDKGMMLAKVAFDWQATDKLKVGAAGLYMLTAEDIEYTSAKDGDNQKEDEIGFELNGYLSYKLYQNVEFAITAGYLFAGDAMDYWEEDSIQDGSSDEDIFRSMARVRYKF